MDLLGPFLASSLGNHYIFVAADYLTRYCETKALPCGTVAEVSSFFILNIVLRHGTPTIVLTDRSTAFTSGLTQGVMCLSGTSHRRTTAYHSQTNGLTERLNKTIADMISMYIADDHRNRDEILPYVTFAYNTAPKETTRFTPFRLVHGREAVTVLDAMLLPDVAHPSIAGADQFIRHAEAARQLAPRVAQTE